ncbi:hypothetical protein TNCV_2046641 [Trichonephila clavipes]|uniref:Uncharacterized protein n=1 Tax=Trichonephila clavipes TaxID=2585209 RepID=A0A8X6T482_TRICX|nr:hypothetical protein TNCV_2046641 [Trichonephila clavipes]
MKPSFCQAAFNRNSFPSPYHLLLIEGTQAKKVARFSEMVPQAKLRRLEQVERDAAHRAAETPEQSQARRL